MSTTPNPTAESVIAEAMVNAGAPLMHSRVEESVAAALRANNLLSEGAPTEALIAEAKRRARKRRGEGWLKEADMLDRLIAALEAAGVGSPVPVRVDEPLPNHCQTCGAWGTNEIHLTGCPKLAEGGRVVLGGAQVERAARALFEDPHMSADYTWAELVEDDPTRAELWRIDARDAHRRCWCRLARGHRRCG